MQNEQVLGTEISLSTIMDFLKVSEERTNNKIKEINNKILDTNNQIMGEIEKTNNKITENYDKITRIITGEMNKKYGRVKIDNQKRRRETQRFNGQQVS